ncbi:hypothetical protein IGI04_018371 [Brassica rapa subsp. trilocularis]|nr:hypothetical protein IGI04_018371 [Brassica rapa subsp. trilocularis]
MMMNPSVVLNESLTIIRQAILCLGDATCRCLGFPFLNKSRRGLEDVESVSSTVLHAKKLAQQMENIHIRIVLWSSLSLLFQMKRCSHVYWLLEELFCVFTKDSAARDDVLYMKSNEVECTGLEKEMMRRKLKAWKKMEVPEKCILEVLQEGLEKLLVPYEKPNFDSEELMSSIYNVEVPVKKLELC